MDDIFIHICRQVYMQNVEEKTRAKKRLQKWIAVYFLEYKGIYTHIDAKGGLLVLKQAPTPEEIVKLGVEGIIKIWKDAKLRGNFSRGHDPDE